MDCTSAVSEAGLPNRGSLSRAPPADYSSREPLRASPPPPGQGDSGMWRCTWGSGLRVWGWRGAACPVRFWSWRASRRGVAAEQPAGRWSAARGTQSAFPLDARVAQDVLLFQHDRGRFFRLLGLFCAGQGLFWTSLAHFAFHSLRPPGAERAGSEAPLTERPVPTLPAGAILDSGSNKWRFGFTGACLSVGFLILIAGYFFARRSIRRIVLHRGGQEVTLTTYYLFGLSSSFTVPLRHISCVSHRSEVPAMIPIKIKGRPLYFLLDKQGKITNAKLFDITVGAYRQL
ncbi:transmembrane protein 223 [Paroedura picta]|uniref:transmembrane protein 223 n=1 Tax=Paroedura picta TaxID=143630 RepID=UPI0040566709